VLVEDIFHLARPHLVATHVDLLLLLVDDVEPASGVHVADVAGVKGAAG
jgi:hypothetical protein